MRLNMGDPEVSLGTPRICVSPSTSEVIKAGSLSTLLVSIPVTSFRHFSSKLQQFYIASLQGSVLKSAPSPTLVKQCGLNQGRVGHWRQTQRNRKTIPIRRISHREGAAQLANSPHTRDQ